jgi:hypothetical protein
MSLWAITSFFNPIRYESRRSAYKIFRKNLRGPLVTVELSFDGLFDLQINDADILIQISGGAIGHRHFNKELILYFCEDLRGNQNLRRNQVARALTLLGATASIRRQSEITGRRL